MSQFELIDVVEVNNTLGECVLWDDRKQSFWWTDIQASKLFEYDYIKRKLVVHSVPERLASFGFTEDKDTLVCAFASGFALYNPISAQIDWLAKPEPHLPFNRFNDGRVDREGRFWAGTMAEQGSDAQGSLYCLNQRECTKIFSDIGIPNSLCWSPDGNKLYFADSTTHTIQVHEFEQLNARPANAKLFANTTPHAPDGSTVDADGCLWNALWGGGKVIRYNPEGTLTDELQLPVSQPTCVAFGGVDMNLLFVSTANEGLTDKQLKQQPQAGNLFIYQTPYSGLREPRFRI